MKSLWLACCACSEYPLVQREVEARDASARVLRLDRLDLLQGVAEAFVEPPTGVALYAWKAQADMVLDVVQRLSGDIATLHVVVVTDDLDPGWIAQLFHAGADEVIADDGDTGTYGDESAQACMEGNRKHAVDAPRADVQQGVEASCHDGQLARNATEVCPKPAPQPQQQNQTSFCSEDVDDLDEPDSMMAPQGAARDGTPVSRGVAENSESKIQDAAGANDHGSRLQDPAGASERMSAPDTPPANNATVRAPQSSGSAHRAPVVCAVAGKGGCGKTTVIATIAQCAARLGLRTAVLDLDLMFGNLYELLGVEALHDLGGLIGPAPTAALDETAVVQTSMRVAPRLTLWGPLAVPERAELLGPVVERLLAVLQQESDVVFVDTSCTWTDAVAATVAACDRCLVVSDHTVGSVAAVERIVSMVTRLGVPRTRMVCMVNRVGQRACTEDMALRLEMAASLSAKTRIPDGGHALTSLLSFGRAGDAARSQDAFGRSVRSYTRGLLRELGCPVGLDFADDEPADTVRPRLHLPWKKAGGAL